MDSASFAEQGSSWLRRQFPRQSRYPKLPSLLSMAASGLRRKTLYFHAQGDPRRRADGVFQGNRLPCPLREIADARPATVAPCQHRSNRSAKQGAQLLCRVCQLDEPGSQPRTPRGVSPASNFRARAGRKGTYRRGLGHHPGCALAHGLLGGCAPHLDRALIRTPRLHRLQIFVFHRLSSHSYTTIWKCLKALTDAKTPTVMRIKPAMAGIASLATVGNNYQKFQRPTSPTAIVITSRDTFLSTSSPALTNDRW